MEEAKPIDGEGRRREQQAAMVGIGRRMGREPALGVA
jgi:hypothetical protein